MSLRHKHADWSSLPTATVTCILAQLVESACADESERTGCARDYVQAHDVARAIVAIRGVCKSWRECSAHQLRLRLLMRCICSRRDCALLSILKDAGASITELRLQPCHDDIVRVWALIRELMRMGFWRQGMDGSLEVLTGMPFAWPAVGYSMPAAVCRNTLRALQCYVPPGVAEVTFGYDDWWGYTVLEEAAICAPAYTTVTVMRMPETLRQLSITAEAVYIDMPLLLSIPCVTIAAREIYLIPNTPAENSSSVAEMWHLSDFVAAVAECGMRAGHAIQLSTEAIWYKALGGQRCVWLHAIEIPEDPAPKCSDADVIARLSQCRPWPSQPSSPDLPPLLPAAPPDVLREFSRMETPPEMVLVEREGNVRCECALTERALWPIDARMDQRSVPAMRVGVYSTPAAAAATAVT